MAFTPFTPGDHPSMAAFNEKFCSIDADKVPIVGKGINLLDNWYFADPINQRGKTEYTEPGNTIDRWYLNLSSASAGGIQIQNDCIQFIATGGMHIIQQKIEGLEKLSGKTVTLSVLVDTFGLVSVTTPVGSIRYKYFNGSTSADGYMSVEQLSSGIVQVTIGSSGTARKVYAAKLELGTQQTLAHQDAAGNWVLNDPPPNKALELLKCQRYYQKSWVGAGISSSVQDRIIVEAINNTTLTPVRFPVKMRIAPAIKTYNMVDGTINTVAEWTSSAIVPCTSRNVGPFGFMLMGSGFETGKKYSFQYEASADI